MKTNHKYTHTHARTHSLDVLMFGLSLAFIREKKKTTKKMMVLMPLLSIHSPTSTRAYTHTRTHLPIEKAPKIITLIWFSGSNLILSLSFTSHSYFLSIFPPHRHRWRRRWQQWHDGGACCWFFIYFLSYFMLSLSYVLLVNDREKGEERESDT